MLVVPFGKYRGQPVSTMVADASYVDWLVKAPWFPTSYPAVYAAMKEALGKPMEPLEPPTPFPKEHEGMTMTLMFMHYESNYLQFIHRKDLLESLEASDPDFKELFVQKERCEEPQTEMVKVITNDSLWGCIVEMKVGGKVTYELREGLKPLLKARCKKIYDAENLVHHEKSLQHCDMVVRACQRTMPLCIKRKRTEDESVDEYDQKALGYMENTVEAWTRKKELLIQGYNDGFNQEWLDAEFDFESEKRIPGFKRWRLRMYLDSLQTHWSNPHISYDTLYDTIKVPTIACMESIYMYMPQTSWVCCDYVETLSRDTYLSCLNKIEAKKNATERSNFLSEEKKHYVYGLVVGRLEPQYRQFIVELFSKSHIHVLFVEETL